MKLKKIIKYLLLSLISTYSFFDYFLDNPYFYSGILFVLFFIVYYKFLENTKKLENNYKFFSLIVSIVIVFLYSYQMTSTASLFYGGNIINLGTSLIKISGFYNIIKLFIYYFVLFMQKCYKKEFKIGKCISKHPFLYSFIFLSLCYGVYLLFYYPGILNYDNANQIREVMGLHTRYLDEINPISNGTLTNFNPIVHTILLGGLFKLGYIIGSVNFGLFMYSLVQLLIIISIYSFIISYSINAKMNPIYATFVLLILGIIPLFGFYSITAVKDTLYTAFLLLFTWKVYDITNKDNLNYKDYIALSLISLLVCLFRNNGVFVIIVTIPFLINKSNKLKMVGTYSLILLIYFGFNMTLPFLGISGTSVREALSIPFQQTARDVLYNEFDYSKEDKLVIDKVLNYNSLKEDYDEDLADPVKNKYRKDASREDLVLYFKVWVKHFLKNPSTYLNATINNISGYFNPFESYWKTYYKLNPELPSEGFDYHFNNLSWGRDALRNYELNVEKSILGIILNVAVITWMSILMFMILKKSKNYIFMIPNMVTICFCVLSPANTYFRYIYPSLLILVLFFPYAKHLLENTKNIN